MPAVRAWAAVHYTRSGAAILVVTFGISILGSQELITEFGGIQLGSPIPILLVLPVIAAVGASVSCTLAADDQLPQPARAGLLRLGWAAGWSLAAAGVASAGALVSDQISADLTVRNLLVFVGLALLVVAVGQPSLAWIPPMVLMFISMTFGFHDEPGDAQARWWAIVVSDRTPTFGEWAIVAGGWSIAVGTYALAPFIKHHQR